MNWTNTPGLERRLQGPRVVINLYDHSVMVGKVPGHENLGEESWVLCKQ